MHSRVDWPAAGEYLDSDVILVEYRNIQCEYDNNCTIDRSVDGNPHLDHLDHLSENNNNNLDPRFKDPNIVGTTPDDPADDMAGIPTMKTAVSFSEASEFEADASKPYDTGECCSDRTVVLIDITEKDLDEYWSTGQPFLPHMLAACIAFWCCGGVFGVVAFALAGEWVCLYLKRAGGCLVKVSARGSDGRRFDTRVHHLSE